MDGVLVDQATDFMDQEMKGVIPISRFGFKGKRSKTVISLRSNLHVFTASMEGDFEEKLPKTLSQTGDSFQPG
jgi:hypothetical protein